MWVLVVATGQIGNPDLGQQIDRHSLGLAAPKAGLQRHRLADLVADLLDRIEARQWVLEDDPDMGAANLPQRRLVQVGEVVAIEPP